MINRTTASGQKQANMVVEFFKPMRVPDTKRQNQFLSKTLVISYYIKRAVNLLPMLLTPYMAIRLECIKSSWPRPMSGKMLPNLLRLSPVLILPTETFDTLLN